MAKFCYLQYLVTVESTYCHLPYSIKRAKTLFPTDMSIVVINGDDGGAIIIAKRTITVADAIAVAIVGSVR